MDNDFIAAMQQEPQKPTEASANKELESSNDFSAEKTANAIAGILLAVGIIAVVILVFLSLMAFSDDETGIGFTLLGSAVGSLLVSLLSWSSIKLLSNISYRLTRIDNKMK